MKWAKILYSSSGNLLIGRIGIAGLSYIGTFFLATILPAAEYGELAFTIFVIKSVVLSSLGAGQGLVFFVMRDDRTYYKSYLVFAILSVLVFSTLYGLLYEVGHFFLIYLVGFVAIVEPYLKVKQKFLVSLFPEFFLVISFCAVFLLRRVLQVSSGALDKPEFMLVILVGLFTIIYRDMLRDFFCKSLMSRLSLKKTKDLLLQGLPSYLFNLVFFLFLLVDRAMVSNIYGEGELGVIMLAYQLALIAGFLISALNAKAIVDIGHTINTSPLALPSLFLKRLGISVGVGLVSLLLILGFLVVGGDYFFSDYDDLIYYFIVYGASLLVFNAFGSVSPVLFYVKKQLVPVISIVVSLLALYSAHKFLPQLGYSLLGVETIAYLIFALTLVVSISYSFIKARHLAAR